MVDIDVSGETLTLLPERAAYWPRTRTLFVADLHLGKTAAFRAHGIPLPDGTTVADLDRLSRALTKTGARKLIILGDLLHAAKGRDESTLAAISAWRAQHPELVIYLIRGNHDRHAGDPPKEWNIQVVDGPTSGPVFVLNHEPITPEQGYALSGHVHPAVQLTGHGRQSLTLPCFWFSERCGVLPAFGSFTGTAAIQPRHSDQLFLLTDNKVIKRFAFPSSSHREGES
jgi:DNA ligase-associated metallophosphoesterase